MSIMKQCQENLASCSPILEFRIREDVVLIDLGLLRDKNHRSTNANIKNFLEFITRIINTHTENKEEPIMIGETTTVTFGAWVAVNKAVDHFVEVFAEDEKDIVGGAFTGDEDAKRQCIEEIEHLEKVFAVEMPGDTFCEGGRDLMKTTIQIFRNLMDFTDLPYGVRFNAAPMSAYLASHALVFGNLWTVISAEEVPGIPMTDENLKEVYTFISDYINVLNDRVYVVNTILAKHCTSIDYDASSHFVDIMDDVALRIRKKLQLDENEKVPVADSTASDDDDTCGTIFDDLMDILRDNSETGEKFESCIFGLCTEMVDNMFYHAGSTDNLGFGEWLSPTLIGVCQELRLLQDKENPSLLNELHMMIADILELLVKAKYYPNIAQRKYHLPEFDIHALSAREIVKLKDTSLYLLNHLIYEIDEACGMDTAKKKEVCFIHISEFAHYGLTCATRLAKVEVDTIRDTVNDLKRDAEQSHNKPVITAMCEGEAEEEEDDSDLGDYDFEDAHDQMLLYAKLRKEEHEHKTDQNEMEEWLMGHKIPLSRNFTKEDFERYRQRATAQAQKYLEKFGKSKYKELEKRADDLRKNMRAVFKKGKK